MSASSPTPERIEFKNSLGQRLVGVVHPAAGRARGTAAICHGMLSTKESEKHVAIAERLAAAGFATLRFDFSFCGESEGNLFEMTFSQEVDDLRSAVTALEFRAKGPLSLVGSSMGGAIALLAADSFLNLRAVVTLAAVAFPGRLPDRVPEIESVDGWKKRGYVESRLGRIGYGFHEDALRQDVIGAASHLRAALLVIHGGRDEVVPPSDAQALVDASPGPKRCDIVPEADHRFSRPEHRALVVEKIASWILRHCAGSEVTTG